MSYDIIKSICIKDNKVFLTSASNNLCPHRYERWESTALTNLLAEKGREAVDKMLLRDYWGGEFQGGSNNYAKAVKYFNVIHSEYNWGSVSDVLGGGYEYTYGILERLLYKTYVEYKARKKGRFILTRGIYCFQKLNQSRYKATIIQAYQDGAKVFTSHEDALVQQAAIAKHFNGDMWEIVRLA